MTVFNDSDRIAIFNPEKGQADYVSEKARTIIIDTGLLERGQEHRYRFTMGHEYGHLYLHPQYFTIDPNQMTLDMYEYRASEAALYRLPRGYVQAGSKIKSLD